LRDGRSASSCKGEEKGRIPRHYSALERDKREGEIAEPSFRKKKKKRGASPVFCGL